MRAMRFTRLKLAHWRNFPSLQVTLEERVLLFGPNASGKSHLLDALRFVSELARPGGGLWRSVTARGGRGLRSQQGPAGTDLRIDLEAEIAGEAWGYGLALTVDKLGQARVRAEVVSQGRRKLLRRPEADDRREPGGLAQTHLEQASRRGAFEPLVEFLASVRWFGGTPAPGELLREVMALPRRSREARLRRVVELARVALPRLDRLLLEHDEEGAPQLVSRLDRGRAALQVPVAELSPSSARLLALLWEATGPQAGPWLIEDPEQGLHPEAVGRLLELLASAAPRGGRQLLVSTHAERLLDDPRVAPSEVLMLNPTADGTHVERASDDTQVQGAVEVGLGPLVAARTSPSGEGQIALFFPDEA